ncbi:iron chelate uptake ABC transporter family permease subunit [Elioraea sp.]|uniref:iron chelate uptake ABC transporter family permease subunit n=1 Tax=Elioraea sp. TaxID=2185103 RepID=UPI0025B9C477|nr:iron chelate uptake ABC transporter family permease subunit [Elioraea sp.]
MISLLQILADPYNQLPAITFRLLGALSGTTRGHLLVAALPALAALALLFLVRWRLDLLTLGEDEARALGVNTTLLRAAAIIGATLATASVTAIAGAEGPLSMLLGAAFLLAVDTVARTAARVEIPLGILTTALGTPLFLWLLARARRGTAA